MFPGSAVILQYFQFATIAITMTFVAISFGYMAACIFGRVEIAMQVLFSVKITYFSSRIVTF